MGGIVRIERPPCTESEYGSIRAKRCRRRSGKQGVTVGRPVPWPRIARMEDLFDKFHGCSRSLALSAQAYGAGLQRFASDASLPTDLATKYTIGSGSLVP